MDWHVLTPGDPRDPLYNTPPVDPKDFFTEMAQFVMSGGDGAGGAPYTHVLYEI